MLKGVPVGFISKVFSYPFPLDLSKYQVIVDSESEGEGSWTGGCSCLKDKDGMIYLAYRVRNLKKRGYKLCIVSSEDGIHFDMIKSMFKQDFGVVDSLERPCLLQDPKTGKYKLYLCLDKRGEWLIYKLEEADSPSSFDPATARKVFSPSPENEDSRKVKDPYIINFAGLWHMFYSGSGEERGEDSFLAISQDGENWTREGKILPRGKWHNYHTRTSCLIPTRSGFFLFYEGSNSCWYKPHFNLNIGLAFTSNLRDFLDLTLEKPCFSSPTGGKFSTVRYLDYVQMEKGVFFYYEAAKKEGSFELRASKIEMEDAKHVDIFI